MDSERERERERERALSRQKQKGKDPHEAPALGLSEIDCFSPLDPSGDLSLDLSLTGSGIPEATKQRCKASDS